MNILCIGDVCGSSGRNTIMRFLPNIKKDYHIDFTIINGENSADGNGITKEAAEELFTLGADVITGGNHSLRRPEIYAYMDENPYILRPDNIPADTGSGYCICDLGRYSIAVINLSGKIYLEKADAENPFLAADRLIEKASNDGAKFIIVDFHAEATSEKRAMGIYLDGKISAFFGTHTHVPTADLQILNGGTGYITDLGMTGPRDSVLGVESNIIISRLRDGTLDKFRLADGECMLCGCIFSIDENSGKTVSVKQILY